MATTKEVQLEITTERRIVVGFDQMDPDDFWAAVGLAMRQTKYDIKFLREVAGEYVVVFQPSSPVPMCVGINLIDEDPADHFVLINEAIRIFYKSWEGVWDIVNNEDYNEDGNEFDMVLTYTKTENRSETQ